jgi:hypothetical protein
MVNMNTLYKTEISDVRWMAYDIPGNIGWIAYLVCVFRALREKRDAYDPDMEAIVVNAAEKLKRITDVYSHILDEDRKRNAELFEEAFYGKKNLTPQMIDAGAEKMITVPDGADAKALAKVLGNPEMMALLSSLAKTIQK